MSAPQQVQPQNPQQQQQQQQQSTTTKWTEYLKRMPMQDKYNRVCTHMHCVEPSEGDPNRRCDCDGWKYDAENPYFMCLRCKHKQTSHGDITNMKPDDLDRRTLFALQIEKLMNDKSKTEDPQHIQLIMQRLSQLKEQIAQGRQQIAIADMMLDTNRGLSAKLDFSTLRDAPPFEQPVITEIIQNFITYKFGNLQEVHRNNMLRIGAFFINIINRNGMIGAIVNHLPAPLAERWKQYCNPTDPNSPKLKPCDVFGKLMFRVLYRSLKEVMAKNKNLYVGHEQQLLLFVLDLEKELMNDNSIILNPEAGIKRAEAEQPQQQPGLVNTNFNPMYTNNPMSINPNNPNLQVQNPNNPGPITVAPGAVNSNPILAPTGLAMNGYNVNSINPKQLPGGNMQPQANGEVPRAGKTTPSAAGQNNAINPPVDPQQLLGPETGMDANASARDAKAKMEERKGVLRFQVVSNDGKREHLMMLATLKQIFSKQLPKMPREYIVRLVFDRNHRSLALIKHGIICGGICFRPFRTQGFAEIAFCAIVSSEQVKGYGTHLMNHLKEVCRLDSVFNFLTYADNFAVGYFKKQGFTKEITMKHEIWKGFIKDYEGGTLMECCIHPNINYLQIPLMITKQREAIYEKIKELSNSHIVHRGLNFQNGQRHIPIDQIAGIRESGWVSAMSDAEKAGLQKWLEGALADIMNHPSAWPFLKPVDPNEVSDYYLIIKDPIDLQTISERLAQKHYYIAKEIFFADLRRMCTNCRVYNSEGTQYYEAANEIEKQINKWANQKITV